MVRPVLAQIYGPDLILILLVLVGFVLVVWTVIDVARRPRSQLNGKQKAVWIIGVIAGWYLLILPGLIASIIYLTRTRKELDASP